LENGTVIYELYEPDINVTYYTFDYVNLFSTAEIGGLFTYTEPMIVIDYEKYSFLNEFPATTKNITTFWDISDFVVESEIPVEDLLFTYTVDAKWVIYRRVYTASEFTFLDEVLELIVPFMFVLLFPWISWEVTKKKLIIPIAGILGAFVSLMAGLLDFGATVLMAGLYGLLFAFMKYSGRGPPSLKQEENDYEY
jgi:hypothetical protein